MTRENPVGDGLLERARGAVERITAPDVVIAVSERGCRNVVAGGTAPRSSEMRVRQRYEIGSASKTFAALLLADLVEQVVVNLHDPAVTYLHLPTHPSRQAAAVTLYRLATHTSGLPRLPRDFYRQALPCWNSNPYADYPPSRLLDAFARSRPRNRGTRRWHYSNFGAAVLGHALAHATATPYDELLTERILSPLALPDTDLRPAPTADAVGHRRDGHTPVPTLEMGGFTAAGAVRATPDDLLTYLEAHLEPDGRALAAALRRTRTPTTDPGFGHPHTHTLTWFRHPTDDGPAYFHPGATPGQQAFLGFRPGTQTAVAAMATRRHTHRDTFTTVAHELLTA